MPVVHAQIRGTTDLAVVCLCKKKEEEEESERERERKEVCHHRSERALCAKAVVLPNFFELKN